MFSDIAAPQVMKGNLLDLDFTMDLDHRKRRRNRTTQSCLNCHTSKRKCDRKRPCQRCIQLGLTGLCVYEVDDPSLRDDPDVDETTRLRNRIAELESLVRELRGKPHPRWADPNYYDGDSGEKWHTRSQKRNQVPKRRKQTPEFGEDGANSAIAVKIEPMSDMTQTCYYRLSPSPPSNAPYGAFEQNAFSPTRAAVTASYDCCGPEGDSPLSYSPSSPSSSAPPYGPSRDSGTAVPQNPQSIYQFTETNPQKRFARQLSGEGPAEQYHIYDDMASTPSCTCLANPATGATFIRLAQQMQESVEFLQHLPGHHRNSACSVYKRIHELNDVLQCVSHSHDRRPQIYHLTPSGGDPQKPASPYGGFEPQPDHLRSPGDSDLMSPLSTTLSAPTTPHTLQSMQQWEPAQHGGFNPYFPQVPSSADTYEKGVTYDVVT